MFSFIERPIRSCSLQVGYLQNIEKMNDLMTRSFLDYVDLKKQVMEDIQSEQDLETGKLDSIDEQNLSKFFEEVKAIKIDMEEITNLLIDLQDLNEESRSIHSAKILKGIRDRVNSDMVTILRKAKKIKSRLETLDQCCKSK